MLYYLKYNITYCKVNQYKKRYLEIIFKLLTFKNRMMYNKYRKQETQSVLPRELFNKPFSPQKQNGLYFIVAYV